MEEIVNEIDVRKLKDNKLLEETIERLSVVVNNLSFDYNDASMVMANKFIRVNRTLQQSIIHLLSCFIKNISEHDTDLRNEAAIKWAKEVSKIDAYFPLI